MLEKVGFKNFLALRDVEIDLEPFTVIVGPNSSGKSTILEGIRRISYLKKGMPRELLKISQHKNSDSDVITKTIREMLSKFSKNDFLEFSFTEDSIKQEIRINSDSNGGFSSEKGFSYHQINNSSDVISRFSANIIKFSYSESAKPSYSDHLPAFLEENGRGLATICSFLQNENPDAFDLTQKTLPQVIRSLKRFRIKPYKVKAENWFNISNESEYRDALINNRSGTGHQLLFDFDGVPDVPANLVSEGTLFALTVLVIAASSSEDTVILIDDLERGLHPKAVGELMTALRDIQKLKPGLQIIATSHSPYVLHSLKPNEVRVVTLDPERGTLVAPLEAYPEFDKWRDAMTPGEFWSFVGEDWVKDLPTLEKTSV